MSALQTLVNVAAVTTLLFTSPSVAAISAVEHSPEAGAHPEKVVLYTPWWPPGSEREAEAVGILSRGEIFMTGMMENNHSLDRQIEQELLDVADIAAGGKTDMDHLVSCFVNSKFHGTADAVREVYEQQVEAFGGAALTFVELVGEYSVFNTSSTCRSVVPASGTKRVVRGANGTHNVAVAAGTLVHVSVEAANLTEALAATAALLDESQAVTDAAPAQLVDCFVALTNISAAAEVRNAFNVTGTSPALTIVGAGLSPGANIALQCVASTQPVSITSAPRRHSPRHRFDGDSASSPLPVARAVTSGGFVYVDGVAARQPNATDALVRWSLLKEIPLSCFVVFAFAGHCWWPRAGQQRNCCSAT